MINLRSASWLLLCAVLAACGSQASPTQTSRASPAPSPSVAPNPSVADVPALTASFTSPWYGYTIRYPASWTVQAAETFFEPEAWSRQGEAEWLDLMEPPAGGLFRLASAAVPTGANGTDWIATYYGACDPACEDVVIGGQPARVRDLTATDGEIEATLVVDGRAYVFTLFGFERPLFDAMLATIELRPEAAAAAPVLSPSPS